VLQQSKTLMANLRSRMTRLSRTPFHPTYR
jgi:hypothetical protein